MNFITLLASVLIIAFILSGVIFQWLWGGVVEPNLSSVRWEIVETDIEFGWTYYRDKENPEICFIQRSQAMYLFGFTGFSSGIAYVPCERLNNE